MPQNCRSKTQNMTETPYALQSLESIKAKYRFAKNNVICQAATIVAAAAAMTLHRHAIRMSPS